MNDSRLSEPSLMVSSLRVAAIGVLLLAACAEDGGAGQNETGEDGDSGEDSRIQMSYKYSF